MQDVVLQSTILKVLENKIHFSIGKKKVGTTYLGSLSTTSQIYTFTKRNAFL